MRVQVGGEWRRRRYGPSRCRDSLQRPRVRVSVQIVEMCWGEPAVDSSGSSRWCAEHQEARRTGSRVTFRSASSPQTNVT